MEGLVADFVLLRSFKFWNGDWALGHICLPFRDFLKVFSRSATQEVTRTSRFWR